MAERFEHDPLLTTAEVADRPRGDQVMLEWFRRGRKRPSRSTPDGDYAQLTVPGYGPPPVTRPNDAGPEPAVYGIPPEVPPIGHQPPRREQRPGRGRNS